MQIIRGPARVIPLGNKPESSTEQAIPISSADVLQHELCTPKEHQLQPEPPFVRRVPKTGHGCIVLSRWDKLCEIIAGKDKDLPIDGQSLDPAVVVAVARYGASVKVGEHVSRSMHRSSAFLKASLDDGHTIYGVNTGFGGSANTHTAKLETLQQNLISLLNCGILNDPKTSCLLGRESSATIPEVARFATALPNEHPMASFTMPEAWVRSTLAIRSNSLAHGNSGVRPVLVDGLIHMLNNNIIPVIPLRGSISASGDLIPLSYVAGALQGSQGVQVWVDGHNGRQQIGADVALSNYFKAPLRLGPKEGLAIVNGTAVSAGVGALALHDAHGLIILSQLLTAMGVEAVCGSAESFDPFFAQCRPHPGQAEAASNIRSFLLGSQLVSNDKSDCVRGDCLPQDRYSFRTAAQWLGPQIENMILADEQIQIEINSTTDNPIVDTANEKILHGGNFQAMSITSAVEKIRASLQVVGRMLFSQCTELINPVTNNGLPPNLTADEPSESFLLKGIDICAASLQAELGFLTMPIEPHVQNAEMGNQSLNSLALLSARYTHTAINVLSQLSAAYLLTLCQALDLRVLNMRFLADLEPRFRAYTTDCLNPYLTELDQLHSNLWMHFQREYRKNTAIDSIQRFPLIIQSLQPIIVSHTCSYSKNDTLLTLKAIQQWTERCSGLSLQSYRSARQHYGANPDASGSLATSTRRIYKYVRETLEVPFQISLDDEHGGLGHPKRLGSLENLTIGAQVSKINSAIQNGAIYVPVMDCLRKAEGRS